MMSNLEKYIGIPFVNKGRDTSGLDCWGLVMSVYKEYGITLPDFGVDGRLPQNVHITVESETATKLSWSKIEVPEEPCVVVMSNDERRPDLINHVGVYIGNGLILHTLRKSQSHTFRKDHPLFMNRIKGYYKWLK